MKVIVLVANAKFEILILLIIFVKLLIKLGQEKTVNLIKSKLVLLLIEKVMIIAMQSIIARLLIILVLELVKIFNPAFLKLLKK